MRIGPYLYRTAPLPSISKLKVPAQTKFLRNQCAHQHTATTVCYKTLQSVNVFKGPWNTALKYKSLLLTSPIDSKLEPSQHSHQPSEAYMDSFLTCEYFGITKCEEKYNLYCPMFSLWIQCYLKVRRAPDEMPNSPDTSCTWVHLSSFHKMHRKETGLCQCLLTGYVWTAVVSSFGFSAHWCNPAMNLTGFLWKDYFISISLKEFSRYYHI